MLHSKAFLATPSVVLPTSSFSTETAIIFTRLHNCLFHTPIVFKHYIHQHYLLIILPNVAFQGVSGDAFCCPPNLLIFNGNCNNLHPTSQLPISHANSIQTLCPSALPADYTTQCCIPRRF